MKLLEFGFKNIFSYGNKLQKFEIKQNQSNLVLVHGKRGGGKSSIKESIILSAFGKSPNRSLKNIPNRLNKNSYLYTKFVASNGDIVDIERGLAPNFMNLKINGEVPPKLPNKNKIDEYIENVLINIPFNVFCNTITISVNDFKSFVSLAPADKRKIVDKIFGVGEINDMNSMNKLDLQKLQQKVEVLNMNISRNNDILLTSQNQLTLLKNDVKVLNEAKINSIKSKLLEHEEELKLLKEKRDETYKLYLPYADIIKSLTDEVGVILEEYSKSINTISEIDKKMDIYSKNKCPHCLSDLTGQAQLTIKDKLILKKEQLVAISTENKTKIQSIRLTINDNSKIQKEYSDEWRDQGNNIGQMEFIKKSLEKDLFNESKEEKTDLESSRIGELINQIEEKIELSKVEIESFNEDIIIHNELARVLAEDGMKKLFMSKIIPMINEKIIERCSEIEFPYSFEFDANFDPIIMHLGQDIELESLSTGEQKEMNLITLFCILDLIIMKLNLNFLFLDEVFTSLDSESIYKVVSMLRSFTDKHKITVFAISHDPLPAEFFDSKISIIKDKHFSDIIFE